MSITVIGTIGIDSISTPFGNVKDVLGGSASYFALAASSFSKVYVVATVGTDLAPDALSPLGIRDIDGTNITSEAGATFRWGGNYHHDFNTRDTLYTELGVLATFQPNLNPAARGTPIVFLANLQPDLQASVIEQTPDARLHALDTMNFWITQNRTELAGVLRSVDIVFMAEDELRQFAGVSNLRTAARAIFALGPRVLVIKLGSYGALLIARDGHFFAAPAFPLDEVRDPTGAGDAFAGGFLGYLAARIDAGYPLELVDYRRALVHGNIMGAFACEAFGVERLISVQPSDIAIRYRELIAYTHINEVPAVPQPGDLADI